MNIKIFDGGMGTMLHKRGLPNGVCPELWNLEQTNEVTFVHKQYVESGADIITTNTFGGNRIKLQHYHLADKVALLNQKGVEAALSACNCDTKIAGSVGSTGKFLKPLGEISFDEACDVFYEQITALVKAGVDYIIIETIIDIQEMRAALTAAKTAGSKQTICQLSFDEDQRTITGTDPKTAMLTLSSMGADIVGANCSVGPDKMVSIVEKMFAVGNVPISVQANAGMPSLVDGKTVFPMQACEFASFAPRLINAGASYIGGCCGTTPAHIKALKEQIIKGGLFKAKKQTKTLPLALTSRSRHVFIGHGLPTVIIGERINPSGRKSLAKEIASGSFVTVKREALLQTKAGADVLDINMGVPDIDQAEVMQKAIFELSSLVDVPFAIDTTNTQALESALKNFPGRVLINSVSYEEQRLHEFLPLAKKFGAAVLCLPITKGGVPQTARERVLIARKIIHTAFEYGLNSHDLMLDPLVLTIAADNNAGCETLKTLSMYREIFGYPTAMGLSNISFGLPNRSMLNAAFYSLAIQAGLLAPILNPYDQSMQQAIISCNLLQGFDTNAKLYVDFAQNKTDNNEKKTSNQQADNKEMTILEQIKNSVVTGEKETITILIQQALNSGHFPLEITENALAQAMSIVGTLFSTGKCFLPQVMLSAETMKVAFDEIKKHIPKDALKSKGTVLLATVQGDIHDLGKNIVAALLENNSYKVIDLGKDVSRETILKESQKQNPDVIGLSALMTTTLPEVDKIISLLKDNNINAKIIVGGAVLTEEYAKKAGADAYAKDAICGLEMINALAQK